MYVNLSLNLIIIKSLLKHFILIHNLTLWILQTMTEMIDHRSYLTRIFTETCKTRLNDLFD